MLSRCAVAASAALFVGLILGGAIARLHYKSQKAPFDYRFAYQRRAEIIDQEAQQIAPGQLAVVGDSIVERQRLRRLCGLDALNAGASSARAADILEILMPAVRRAQPSRAVLAVGTNDYRENRPVDRADWRREVRAIVEQLPRRPIVVGIGALPGTPTRTLADANAFLRAEAARRGGRYVEPLPQSLLADGIHPSLAGQKEWQARVEAACAA